MPELTEQYILSLAPKDQAYDMRHDDELAIRVFPNGIKTWVFIYKVNDFERRRTLGIFPEMSLEQAVGELVTARKIAALARDLEVRQDVTGSTTVVLKESSEHGRPLWQRGNILAAAAAAVIGVLALVAMIASQHEPSTATLGETPVVDPISEQSTDEESVAASVATPKIVESVDTPVLDDLKEIQIGIEKRYPEVYVTPLPEVTEPPVSAVIEDRPVIDVEPEIRRAQFASAVENREPVDQMAALQLTWQEPDPKHFHFFTEFYNAEDQVFHHRWHLNGELISSVSFTVKSPYRWRVYSKKRVTSDLVGEWRVDVTDDSGNVLHSDSLNLVPERTLADTQ